MLQIRKGVFETNSSSVHTICISTNDYITDSMRDSIEMYKEYGMPCVLGEFGWDEDTVSYNTSRLSYLYTTITQLNECYKNNDNYNKYSWNYVTDVFDELGIELHYDNSNEWYGIDHVTETIEFLDYIYENKCHLISFIFNDDSCVYTGNDNEENYTDEKDIDTSNLILFCKGN